MIIMLSLPEQDIEIMVPKNVLSTTGIDQRLNKFNDGWTVGATVGQIAEKNKSTTFGV